jgi:hypothetical protein
MILPMKWGRASSGPGAGSARRPARATPAEVEALEGRALLSRTIVISNPHDLGVPLVYRGPDIGPIHNIVGNGFAVKESRFYPYYRGPKRIDLNAVAARGLVTPDNQTIILRGITVDPLPKTITDPTQSDFYFFGINRGGATPPGPFPGRPHVTFDAVVGVALTPNGLTGFVKDLNSNAPAVALPAGSVSMKFNVIRLAAPLSLLPPTAAGITPAQYQVNFFSANTPTLDFNQIASFVPDFRDFPVAAPSVVPPGF